LGTSDTQGVLSSVDTISYCSVVILADANLHGGVPFVRGLGFLIALSCTS
jgi:hypothetical protein